MLNGVPRILIIRLSAIGDVVRVLPALHTLREAFPSAQIDWVIERKSVDIVSDHPGIDNVILFERTDNFRESLALFRDLCRQVRRNRYDMVIDFHGILKSGLLAWSSRAPERLGFTRPRSQEFSHLFANRKVRLPADNLNRIEENLLLTKAIAPSYHKLDATIAVPIDVQETIEDFMHDTFEGAKFVVAMHVPVDRKEKQWPLEYFAELADMLLADGRFEVLLTWGPGQRADVDTVVARMRREPDVAPEMPDLKHYAWLAHQSDLYFGGDTGPMHIASVMGTPVVAVFGGTDPAKHSPYRPPYEILQGEGATPEEKLRAITPEMAYDACISLLHPTTHASKTS